MFVLEESPAILEDFFNHLMAESLRMTTKVIEPEGEGEVEYLPSWMDIHHCFNGENLPCEQPYMVFQTEVPDESDPCLTAPQWSASDYLLYVVGFKVKDEGKIWQAKNTTHTWIKPALTGDGSISWDWVKDCSEPVGPPAEPPAEPDLCDTTAAWVSQVYPTGTYVKSDNKIWKAKENNTFTWIKPALTGDGSLSWSFVKDCPL